MNTTEADTFLTEVAFVFPGLFEWVREKSPSPKETIAGWKTSFVSMTIDEARDVLGKWIDGTHQDSPTGFNRERFTSNLWQHVRATRAAARCKEIQAETHRAIGRRDPNVRLPGSESLFRILRDRMSSEPGIKPAAIIDDLYSRAVSEAM